MATKKRKSSSTSKSKSKKNSHTGLKIGIAATAAAAAAGAYFLYGSKEGATRRKKVKGWVLKIKGEVLEKMEEMEEVTQEKYHEIIDEVATEYRRLKNIDRDELGRIVSELKRHWKEISAEAGKSSKKKTSGKK